MKKTNIVLLLTLITAIFSAFVPLPKNIFVQIALCVLFITITYIFFKTVKYDNIKNTKSRFIISKFCVIVYIVSVVFFQMSQAMGSVNYNTCIYMAFIFFVMAMVLTIFAIKVHSKMVHKNRTVAKIIDFIIAVNAVCCFMLAIILLFGYFVVKRDGNIIIISI